MTRLRAWQAAHERALARLELGLVVAMPLLFLVAALIKAHPFVDDTPLLVSPTGELLPGNGDDWFSYKIHAINILRGGLAEPAIGKYVFTVHGFLYNYFVAGIFAIFGVNTSVVYVVQTALVGASPSILYAAIRLIRGRIPHLAAIAFILVAAGQLYIDYFRYLSFFLMSENLFLFLFSVTFLAYAWAFGRRSHAGAVAAGILLGLTVLSRISANVAALGVIAVAPAYFLFYRRGSARLTMTLALAAGFLLAMSLFPLREYAATGQPDLDVFLVKHGWDTPPAELSEWPGYYGARWLFVFGIPQWLAVYDPGIIDYRVRPHWMVECVGVIGYLVTRFTWRRVPDLREFVMLTFLTLYLSAYVFVSTIENYGGRSISVALPLAAVFGAFLLCELLGDPIPKRSGPVGAGAS